jgi:hypothetical protein
MELAKEIARRALDGGYDVLLACRDLARLRLGISRIGDKIMDVFVGVASEIDGLPVGAERKHWAEAVLKLKDIEIADYRERVRGGVTKALRELLVILEKDDQSDEDR